MDTALEPFTRETAKTRTRRHSRAALAAAMLGFGVVTLDAQIANVALPSIHRHLGGGISGLQWVITGYTLMFSALIICGGTLADRFGSRSTYRNGMALFVVASIGCGLAPSLSWLVLARFIQGIGAALLTPTSLSLIRETYEVPAERARAIAYWGVGGSVAAAAGPILGGMLTQVDWRLIFFLNLPLGLGAFAALRAVPESPRRAAKFDLVGQVAAVTTMAALTYGVIEGGSIGFANARIALAFGLAILGLGCFIAAQAKRRNPMVPLNLFGRPPVAISLSIAFVTMAAFYGTVFLQSLYFQQQRGESSLVTGLLFLPMTGLVAVTSAAWARIGHRFTRRRAIVAGQLVMASGLICLAAMPDAAPVPLVAVLMVLVGVGGSATVPPIAALILDSVPAGLAGTASGVLNTSRQMGGSLGVAAFGSLVNASSTFQLGLRTSYSVAAVLLSVSVILVLRSRSAVLAPAHRQARR